MTGGGSIYRVIISKQCISNMYREIRMYVQMFIIMFIHLSVIGLNEVI